VPVALFKLAKLFDRPITWFSQGGIRSAMKRVALDRTG
jgi:hypothetical protein